MPKYFHISTMGCQMNESSSDSMITHLKEAGYKQATGPENADLILINTCTVRAKAQQKAYSLLGRMIKLTKKRPDVILGFMGCIAQQEGAGLLKKFSRLDFVLGTREGERIIEILERVENGKERIVATDLSIKPVSILSPRDHFKGRIKDFLSIMEGCDNFCSYCIVPHVRGREVSHPPREILKQARNMVFQGIKDITLLGQNVNSYSFTENGDQPVQFFELLKMLNSLDGLKRIRFTTSHPKDLSVELINCFGSLDKLCAHIHLPFQSGSNSILKAMNRKYTRNKYIKLIENLREVRPDISITSDVIVGFPGETQKDFDLTLDLMDKIEFDNLFSFKYSDRRGTIAADMSDKVGEAVMTDRLNILQNRQREITFKKNKVLEGRIVEVLVEGKSKKGSQFTGRTKTNKVVNFTCNKIEVGDLIQVEIKQAFFNSLRGVATSDDS